MTRDSVIGVDFSSYWLHLCRLDFDEHGEIALARWAEHRLRKDGESGRREEINALIAVRHAVVWAVSQLDAPGGASVFIERGFGASRRADFLLGSIYGAIVSAFGGTYPGYEVLSLDRSEWARAVTAAVGITTKAGAPGNGNAPKDVLNEACLQIIQLQVATVIPGQLYPESDPKRKRLPDRLDSFGVAYAGAGK